MSQKMCPKIVILYRYFYFFYLSNLNLIENILMYTRCTKNEIFYYKYEDILKITKQCTYVFEEMF